MAATKGEWLRFFIKVLVQAWFVVIGQLFDWIPGFYPIFFGTMNLFVKRSKEMQKTRRATNRQNGSHFFTFSALKRSIFTYYIDLVKKAEVDKEAPNSRVLQLVYEEMTHPCKEARILDFQRGSRPLVIIFGSATCPYVLSAAPEFGEMKHQFPNCDFIMVYVSESHARDEWYVPAWEVPDINQHRTQMDKLDAADVLVQKETGIKVVCDTIQRESELAYGAANCRIYVIKNGIVKFCTGVGQFNFEPDQLREYLSTNCKPGRRHSHRFNGRRGSDCSGDRRLSYCVDARRSSCFVVGSNSTNTLSLEEQLKGLQFDPRFLRP